MDIAGREEGQCFGQRVIEQVKERAERPRHAADSEPDHDEPHVLNAGVREETLVVVLNQHKKGRHRKGDKSKEHEKVSAELRRKRLVHENLAAHDRIHRDRFQHARQHGGDWSRCLAVGFR